MAEENGAGAAAVLRSLAFYAAFYAGSAVLVVWALVVEIFAPQQVLESGRGAGRNTTAPACAVWWASGSQWRASCPLLRR